MHIKIALLPAIAVVASLAMTPANAQDLSEETLEDVGKALVN